MLDYCRGCYVKGGIQFGKRAASGQVAFNLNPSPGEKPEQLYADFNITMMSWYDILHCATELQQVKVGTFPILVFPDHTAKIARARAAFNDVCWQLMVFIVFTFTLPTTVWRRISCQRRRPANMSKLWFLSRLCKIYQSTEPTFFFLIVFFSHTNYRRSCWYLWLLMAFPPHNYIVGQLIAVTSLLLR